jgi:hypothetical protein
MIARKIFTSMYSNQTTPWYLMDNQNLSSIFNEAHKMKLSSEHKQQGTQLQKFITCKPLNQNSCLNSLWKEEDT